MFDSFSAVVDLCDGVKCPITGETCDKMSGVCKCGAADSCEGRQTGDYCDAQRSVCKCSASIDACSGTTDTCTYLGCTCNGSDPCRVPGETCRNGVCKCGEHDSCEGKLAGEYCDPSNHKCKCSKWVDACTGEKSQCHNGTCVLADDVTCDIKNEIREGGRCKCGSEDTCKGKTSGAYCDSENSKCKCTETVESCSGVADQCSLGNCTCGGDSPCNIAGEICRHRKCMCGNIKSCSGLHTGSYCDAVSSKCRCSPTVDACNGTTDRCINEKCTCGAQENLVCSGESDRCKSGQCMCGEQNSCNGTSDRCTNGICKCGDQDPCRVAGEQCKSGTCMCGAASSCEGKSTGSFCDPQTSVCKCSQNTDSCPNGVECDNGDCGYGMNSTHI